MVFTNVISSFRLMLTLKTNGILEIKKNPGVHSGIFQSSLFKQLNEF